MKPPALLTICLLGALRVQAADYYVATGGSDTAQGTASSPLRTIQKGIDFVSQSGGTLTVAPGVYREELVVRSARASGRPFVIRAAQRQGVILDGADRLQGWRLLDAGHHVWGKELATRAPYNNDHGRWDMAPRSEQVFVDGKRCTHVPDDTPHPALPDYGFTATLSDPARYALKLPPGLDPNTATTEIAVRSSLLNVRAEKVVIEGFVFRHARNTYQDAMAALHGEALEFCHNLLEYSSAGGGLAIQTKGAHIHDNVFRHNGALGFSVGGSGNLIENNLVQGNDLAGYREWGTGGTKIVGNGNTIRRNRFLDNLGGVAIWLDCGPCNNRIEYNYVSGNYGEGIRAEISFHSYIGYNIVENTKPCTSTMFGRTQTHCIGISVQNSAEICVVHNLVKDNQGVGIQLSTYNRDAQDLPKWQTHYADEKHTQWLHRSWEGKLVYAYDNVFFNNAVVQTGGEPGSPCVYVMGLLNGQKPHCYGNQFDHNFYWNAVTHSPQVRVKNAAEVPDANSRWRTVYGFDAHALGGFALKDYRQPAFAAEYPYEPTAHFAGIGRGKDLGGLTWRAEADYVGSPLDAGREASIGHVQRSGKARP